MAKFLNEESLEHSCRNGTTFKAARCDLRGGVEVSNPWKINEQQKREDYAEFAAWHALCIHGQLNGFAGYDCIRFKDV